MNFSLSDIYSYRLSPCVYSLTRRVDVRDVELNDIDADKLVKRMAHASGGGGGGGAKSPRSPRPRVSLGGENENDDDDDVKKLSKSPKK